MPTTYPKTTIPNFCLSWDWH